MRKEENRKYVKAGITAFVVIGVCILLAFSLFRLDDISRGMKVLTKILKPFLYAAVIAYILSPLCDRLQRLFGKALGDRHNGLRDGLSILVSLSIFLLIIILLISIVIPQVIRSLLSLVNTLPGELVALSEKIDEIVSGNAELEAQWQNISTQILDRIQEWRDTGLMPLIQRVISGTATYVSTVMNLLTDLLLSLVLSVYFLATRNRFAAQAELLLRSILPEIWAERVIREVHYADEMFNGFFMGKLLDSSIIGVICFIGCMIMGFSSAPLIAVVVGVTNIIPFFGPFIGAIPCAIFLLLESPMHCIMFLIFIIILQQLDGNVIGPKILGNTTGLSGFWVTFAILLFGGVWGLLGMIVGVPLFAVIYDIIRKLCYKGLARRGREDLIRSYNDAFHAPNEKEKMQAEKKAATK